MTGVLTIDIDRCTACGRCEIACVVAHSRTKNLADAVRESVPPKSRIAVTQAEGLPVVLLCLHCADPNCVAVCPASAIEKRATGEVVFDEGGCVGCGACSVACPYGAPIPGRDGRTFISCDLCISRKVEGRIPACAEACPTGAIVYDENAAGQTKVVYRRSQKGRGIYRRMTGG